MLARTALRALLDIADQRDRAESTEPNEKADPMENAEQNEPIEPIEHAEPIEPIDKTEPLLPIERNESSDHNDHPGRIVFAVFAVSAGMTPSCRTHGCGTVEPGARHG
jgi:hypothetical protein